MLKVKDLTPDFSKGEIYKPLVATNENHLNHLRKVNVIDAWGRTACPGSSIYTSEWDLLAITKLTKVSKLATPSLHTRRRLQGQVHCSLKFQCQNCCYRNAAVTSTVMPEKGVSPLNSEPKPSRTSAKTVPPLSQAEASHSPASAFTQAWAAPEVPTS